MKRQKKIPSMIRGINLMIAQRLQAVESAVKSVQQKSYN